MKLFDKFDPNGNGILSLAEIEKGLRDVMKIDALFNAKPAIMRAYKFADKNGNGFIGKTEFRLLLEFLDHFFRFWKMFEKMDKDNDRRVTPVEFRAGVKILGLSEKDADAEFKKVDRNGGGFILFDEFCG
jgi:Ca2+-binding EF-hand superfamily protein